MTEIVKPPPNPLEAIRAGYSARARARESSVKMGVVRVSGCGHQPRRTAFDYYPKVFPGETLTDRSMRYFEVGDQRHDALRVAMVEGGLKGMIPTTKDAEQECQIPIPGTSWMIRGHPDGVVDSMTYNGVTYNRVLLEIKTAGAAAWNRILNSEGDEKYLAQAMLYCKILKLDWVCFIYERKDTQDVHMFFLPYDAALADRVLEYTKEAIDAVEAGFSPLDMKECGGQGYGWQTRKVTGVGQTLALGWRCSYCAFAKYCFPTHVRIVSSGKPVCIDVSAVPGDAYVVAMGVEVIPRGTWKMGGQNGTEEGG